MGHPRVRYINPRIQCGGSGTGEGFAYVIWEFHIHSEEFLTRSDGIERRKAPKKDIVNMGIKTKEINSEEYEILEHDEAPGFRKAFHIIICVAVLYFIYIFSHVHWNFIER